MTERAHRHRCGVESSAQQGHGREVTEIYKVDDRETIRGTWVQLPALWKERREGKKGEGGRKRGREVGKDSREGRGE